MSNPHYSSSLCALLNSSTAAAITLSRVNTCIGASDWGVNGEEALQECDKRRSEKIAALTWSTTCAAVDKSVNNLAACMQCSQRDIESGGGA
jgi:hypothetical protein